VSPYLFSTLCLAKMVSVTHELWFPKTEASFLSWGNGPLCVQWLMLGMPSLSRQVCRYNPPFASLHDSQCLEKMDSYGQIVPVMETAEPRHGYNSTGCIGRLRRCTTRRSLLLQCEMRPVVVIIADILVHEPLQMPFVQHNNVVE